MVVGRAGISIAARGNCSKLGTRAKQYRSTHRFRAASLKSVAMIRWDRAIDFTRNNLIHRGNNCSAPELILFVQIHLANIL
jgi:hypothetical protein